MISWMSVSGFKAFKKLEVSLAGLDILVGQNAVGKSTVIQSLLLLRQSWLEDSNLSTLQLNGPLYSAGSARDVIRLDADRRVSLGIEAQGERIIFEGSYESEVEDARQIPLEWTAKIDCALFSLEPTRFSYLMAERLGPRVGYQVPNGSSTPAGVLGGHGEFTAYFLAANDDPRSSFLAGKWRSIGSDVGIFSKEVSRLSALGDQTAALLEYIAPGSFVTATRSGELDQARFAFEQGSTRVSRATNTGFGLSYTLPVLVSCLMTRPGGLLVIENPEAHLHPLGQSRVGRVIALAAATGTQVLIETHSDHVLNGIRRAVKDRWLDASAVRFHFFSRSPDSDTTDYTPIDVNEKGALSDWPEGFFDQIERDLSAL